MMKLFLADFDGVFGLKGKINFTPKAPVILYAPNISGKTNVITAIRMCFLDTVKLLVLLAVFLGFGAVL
ncbi:MAG: hypothetical protein AOA66_0243 [Candidatus Bathyarchaeota archaeon BA2]|nr:MAG: hypothetical protein AOA66_0243 [Candidatus Bathyarchaeota archaeon BA2]